MRWRRRKAKAEFPGFIHMEWQMHFDTPGDHGPRCEECVRLKARYLKALDDHGFRRR